MLLEYFRADDSGGVCLVNRKPDSVSSITCQRLLVVFGAAHPCGVDSCFHPRSQEAGFLLLLGDFLKPFRDAPVIQLAGIFHKLPWYIQRLVRLALGH
jgi:hypothetical protein